MADEQQNDRVQAQNGQELQIWMGCLAQAASSVTLSAADLARPAQVETASAGMLQLANALAKEAFTQLRGAQEAERARHAQQQAQAAGPTITVPEGSALPPHLQMAD